MDAGGRAGSGEGRPPHPDGFVLVADAGDERVPAGSLGRVEDRHRVLTGRDYGPVGEPDPPALVLSKEAIAGRPVGRLIGAPVGVDLPGDLGGQLIG